MKTYKVPCTWVVSGTLEIEAETFCEAVLKAEDAPLPAESEYIEGSFTIDFDLFNEWVENGE
jgi:hypothetical protein